MAEENVLIRCKINHGGKSQYPNLNLDGVLLEVIDHAKMRQVLLSFPEGAWVWNTTKKIMKPRSGKQNRYYRGVLVKRIAEETCGYPASKEDCEAIHQTLAQAFLGYEEVTKGGFTFRVIRSTTTLSTVEMEEYHHNVRTWAQTELGVRLPLPNEVEMP